VFFYSVQAFQRWVLRVVDQVAELAGASVGRDYRAVCGVFDGYDVGFAAVGTGLKVDAFGEERGHALGALEDREWSGVILV
jgi:hypothetical protein